MKNHKIVISSIFITAVAILVFFTSNDHPRQATVIEVTSVARNFSSEGEKVKLGFIDATATTEILSVTLSISGIDYSDDPDHFFDLVCVPNITTQEKVQKNFMSMEMNQEDTTQITYVYELQGNTYPSLHAEMDWTIGPCGNNLGESNYTPFPAELMTNYHFTFVVPVE